MKLSTKPIREFFGAIQRRFVRSRAGSVLIIVIVLIVMLALLATAYLSTTRTDREGSVASVQTAQVDELLAGMARAVQSIIIDGLFDHTSVSAATVTNYRPRYFDRGVWVAPVATHLYQPGDMVSYLGNTYLCVTANTTTAPIATVAGVTTVNANWTANFYRNFDYAGETRYDVAGENRLFLGSRFPTLNDFTYNAYYDSNPNTGANVVWPAVSPVSFDTNFKVPDWPVGSSNPIFPSTKLYPTFKQVAQVSGGGYTGPWYPAFSTVYDNGTLTDAQKVLAGDADGDGIADSYLFPITGAMGDGLKWYACIRIIDHNSAINLNTAWSNNQSYQPLTYDPSRNDLTSGDYAYPNPPNIPGPANSPAPAYFGMFPCNVDARGVIGGSSLNNTSADQINLLNSFRFNFRIPLNPNVQFPAPTPPNQTPFDDTGTARADFQFITYGDSMYHQDARRLASPGYLGWATTNVPTGQFSAFPDSEMGILASRFCLEDPTTLNITPAFNGIYPTSHYGILQQVFVTELGIMQPASQGAAWVPTRPYGDGQNSDWDGWERFHSGNNYAINPLPTATGSYDVNTWWNQNFDYVYGAGKLPKDATIQNDESRRYFGPLFTVRNPVSNHESVVYKVDNTPSAEAPDPYMLPFGGSHLRGAWTGLATYQFNDIVSDNGNFYICVNPNPTVAGPGNIPESHPSAMSSNGASANALFPAGTGTFLNYGTWQLQPMASNPSKTSVNTATFRELYRAYASVMAGNPANQTPFGLLKSGDVTLQPNYGGASAAFNPYYSTGGTQDPQIMFRSSVRDPSFVIGGGVNCSRLDPYNQMLLRAAIAAVNTIGMRDQTQNVISRTVQLTAWVQGAQVPVEARVYSSTPQPFITEVFVSNDSSNLDKVFNTNPPVAPNPAPHPSPQGYVAIELFNPYPFPLSLNGWQVADIKRAAAGYPNLQLGQIGTLPNVVLPPGKFALLENYQASGVQAGNDAGFRPYISGLTTTGALVTPNFALDLYVSGLERVIADQGEVVLLRPRRVDGVYTSTATVTPASEIDPLNLFNEGSVAAPNLYDLIPVDSYDFSGMLPASGTPPKYSFWNYNRGKGLANSGQLFKATYPGRYSTVSASAPLRQEGTFATPFGGTPPVPYPAALNAGALAQFGKLPGISSYTNTYCPIQVVNGTYNTATNLITSLMPGPNPSTCWQPTLGQWQTAAVNKYPFGGFARNGDILDVTYMGAYRLRIDGASTDLSLIPPHPVPGSFPAVAPTAFLELNSLPMDCSFADSMTQTAVAATTPGQYENIGRFCPMRMPGYTGVDYYSWARGLFNYLTVTAPSDDYLPNVDPGINDITNPAWPGSTFKYPPGSIAQYRPQPVYNSDPAATSQYYDDAVGVEGLININTANWKVLAALPLTPADDSSAVAVDARGQFGSPTSVTRNEAIARAIVAYRMANGPFTSILDLNSVVDNVTEAWDVAPRPGGGGNAPGFFSFQDCEEANNAGFGKFHMKSVSSSDGLLSPVDPLFPIATNRPNYFTAGVTSGVGIDFQAQFAQFTRISNLITTRSDTFTVYICVQGWKNANTSDPVNAPASAVVTKRISFVADRSQINALLSSRFLKTVNVPVPNK